MPDAKRIGRIAVAISFFAIDGTAASLPTNADLVLEEYCPTHPGGPRELRCFSRHFVPRSLARTGREQPPLATFPDYADAGPLPVCDGRVLPAVGSTTPVGLAPAELQAASNVQPTPTGAGNVVAIVDPCADSTVLSDLAVYRGQFGLPPLAECGGAPGQAPAPGGIACVGVVSQRGDGNLPPPDSSWAAEISIDVEMVSAACPDCSILLVEANSPNVFDVAAAVNEAAALRAGSISNSYGGDEDPNDPAGPEFSDGTYVGAYSHPGVLVAAASGDQLYLNEALPAPYAPSFPSSIPGVLSVGGTMLGSGTSGERGGFSESVWAELHLGTGSGCSTEFARPAEQSGIAMGSCSMRGTSDVAGAADYSGGGIASYVAGAWEATSGTSLATPFVTALLTRVGLASKPVSFFYENGAAFYDVTVGNNDPLKLCSDVMCNAGPGWDGPTGWGSPNGASLAALANGGTGGPAAARGGCSCELASSNRSPRSGLAACLGLALLVALRRAPAPRRPII
jgi:hypothetical protein